MFYKGKIVWKTIQKITFLAVVFSLLFIFTNQLFDTKTSYHYFPMLMTIYHLDQTTEPIKPVYGNETYTIPHYLVKIDERGEFRVPYVGFVFELNTTRYAFTYIFSLLSLIVIFAYIMKVVLPAGKLIPYVILTAYAVGFFNLFW